MTCESEYSFICLSSKKDYHWLWILLPISLLIVFLIYIFSHPNYARLSSYTYQLINPTKNSINLHRLKQENDVFNQQVKYSMPEVSSKFLFEQSKERIIPKNNSVLHIDKTQYKTTRELNTSNNLTSPEQLDHTSINNSNDASIPQWNELRTPVLANYPDLIDAAEARRIHTESYSRNKDHPLLSEDIIRLIQKGFGESEPYPSNNNLGRIWFFLEYNPYLRQLYLTIIKARFLRSMTNCEPTTFVRAEILPKLNLSFSTDIIKENANPNYMTETIFNINLTEFSYNILKLTVHEVDKDVFHTPIGTTYYPLDHLLIAQRAKGHSVWRNLFPEYGDPSAIGLIQIRATVFYDAKNDCLNIYVHSLRATGVVKEAYQVYVHASVAIHDSPIIPQEHTESSHSKYGPIVSLEQYNDTTYDQLFRFTIYKHEFNEMTVVLDVYRRSLGEQFFNDILLGRTVVVSPEMLTKNLNTEIQPPSNITEEFPLNPDNEKKIEQKKKKRKHKRRK